jgi:hypothetical protein
MYANQLYNDLKAKVGIDKLRLDEELMECPMLLQSVSEHAVDVMGMRDTAKYELDIVIADEARLMRLAEDKISESKIISQMALRPKVQAAQRKLDEFKQDVAYWTALADNYREKASLLRRYAELIVSGYMTQNSVYEERRQEMAQERKFRRR